MSELIVGLMMWISLHTGLDMPPTKPDVVLMNPQHEMALKHCPYETGCGALYAVSNIGSIIMVMDTACPKTRICAPDNLAYWNKEKLSILVHELRHHFDSPRIQSNKVKPNIKKTPAMYWQNEVNALELQIAYMKEHNHPAIDIASYEEHLFSSKIKLKHYLKM